MSNIDENELWSKGVMLKDEYPEILPKLIESLKKNGLDNFIDQLEQLLVPYQILGGRANEFSFLCYTVPRLTFKERQLMVQNEARIANLKDIGVRLDIDEFGKIGWFYVKEMPEMYNRLQQCLSTPKARNA
jgi:hypothetical protein